MSSDTLSKDVYKSTDELNKTQNHFLTEYDFDSRFLDKSTEFFAGNVRPHIQRITDLEKKVDELIEIIETQKATINSFVHNPTYVSETPATDNTNRINELRAEKVFYEFSKSRSHLSSRDILNFCKLDKKDHRTAHRVMDAAEKLFPGKCKHDISKITGNTKHWLAFIENKD